MSVMCSRVRLRIKNDGSVEGAKFVDDLNIMIMQEVQRQRGDRE